MRELFTGKKIVLSHTLGIPRGDIAVIRVVKLMDKCWAFGDTNEFPAERRLTIEDMVASKMSLYFPEKESVKSYEVMMRLAGPYWFSIVAREPECDILDPDYYLSFYRGGKSR